MPFIGVDKHNTSIAYFKQTIIDAIAKESLLIGNPLGGDRSVVVLTLYS